MENTAPPAAAPASGGDSTIGELEVSFFDPFYGRYRIIAIAPDYSSAMVTSSTRDYLWILARESTLPPETFRQYREQAAKLGFDVAAMGNIPTAARSDFRAAHTPQIR